MPLAELDRVFNNTASEKRCVVPRLFSVEMGVMYVDLLCHVLTGVLRAHQSQVS